MKDVKAVLTPSVKSQLLASQALMAALADSDGKQVATIQRQIQADSPQVTHVEYIDKIRELLNIPQDVAIYEYVPVGDKALQHE